MDKIKEELIEKIKKLKKEKNAIILVHNYQDPEIYKIGDFIGDSLELSRRAMEVEEDIIIFCGVRFMAETAKILNPDKKVILPNYEATCSMADMSDVPGLLALKARHPHAAVVCYINTNADVKAHSDVICTSANALKIVESLPNEEIIFLPDKNLAAYIQSKTRKKIIPYEAYCYIHNAFDGSLLRDFKARFPDAEVIAHPESPEDVLAMSDYVRGTSGMIKAARESKAKEFIMVTECGMAEKLRLEVPGKTFHSFCNICSYMKMTNLYLVERALTKYEYEINVPEEIAIKARKAIDRMLELS
ncbi:MAG TPA: quinolinate synthase NadA [Bacteroidia bacterium]|nr:quinolinate synthase NadA [Bacteroidia bacterium]HRS59222.1 quinolinate synthase NadA [Bacteroidia bacterium]